jgi:two-component system, OmpR family, sensor histidine kinase ChvG
MKLFNRIRGPRLSTKLLVWGVLLLIVPWFSYRQLVDMERWMVQGHSQALLMTAESVSTLFNGREDLFNDLPVRIEDYESLYARPLAQSIRIDGRVSDWGEAADRVLRFGTASDGRLDEGGFELLLGERGGQLHGFMHIRDSSLVYRDPASLRLNNTDHIRLSFIRADGEDGRIGVFFPAPGVTTAYYMDADWRYAATGAPVNQVQGYARPVEGGLNVEFRMPLDLLGSHRFFGISYVDVDDPQSRTIRAITQTLPQADKTSFNLVVLRSPDVLNIIQGLNYSDKRILVIDAQNRVRAETGSVVRAAEEQPSWRAPREWFHYVRPLIHGLVMWQRWEDEYSADAGQNAADAAIRSSLRGDSVALRRNIGDGQEFIMAAHPIIAGTTVIGTVVVEQDIDEILAHQRSALEQAIVLLIVSLLLVLMALLGFAGRLAWRIRHLRKEASAAIDQYGRLRTNMLQREMFAGDEIGDLARSVSAMLSKLHQHTQFLENMPRTLRHEINNPLNTLSTSLQNLAQENPEIEQSKYLESAKRGVLRIGAIVQNLADAANLEESLEAEELEIVDIERLIENYVANCRVVHANCTFVFKGTGMPVHARVADYRIEQLLDKIIDNALDFHRANSPIRVQLDVLRDELRITVANRGPTLPPAAESSLFDSMVSHRGADSQNRLHFGLGLYVVRIIAQYHGGSARAVNLADGSGVATMVQLPLATPLIEAAPAADLKALPN